MDWDNPLVFIGAMVLFFVALFGGIIYADYHFPKATSSSYGWGKQICVTTKGWDTFNDKITCREGVK